MVPKSYERKDCRLCKSTNLKQVLDLGYHPHSDQFRSNIDDPETWYPLRLNRCQTCGFVQLSFVVAADALYQSDYLYESSITETAGKHWDEFADSVLKRTGLKSGTVMDIGSNDGTLLKRFKDHGFEVLGIDPCKEVADIAIKNGIPTVVDFFGEFCKTPIGKPHSFDLITGSNVFAHIDNLDSVMAQVESYLTDDGTFIFESPYVGEFLKNLEYDTIYHQHLSYLGLKPLLPFFRKFGLQAYAVEFSEIHGGCFRVYIGREGKHEIDYSIAKTMSGEMWHDGTWRAFADEVKINGIRLFNLMYEIAEKQGRPVVAVSSPAKGQTLLNYTGVGRFLKFATDKSKLKQGRYTPGTHLKIKSDKDLKGNEVGLLLAWNFKEEVMRNVPQIKTWIIPVPSPTIVER